jgi:hypothetical protein
MVRRTKSSRQWLSMPKSRRTSARQFRHVIPAKRCFEQLEPKLPKPDFARTWLIRIKLVMLSVLFNGAKLS